MHDGTVEMACSLRRSGAAVRLGGKGVKIGPARTFWIYASVSLFAFLFVLFMIPETKGRTLEQIEKSWSNQSRAA